MTIFYLDPVGGSDAAAGTSWGTAWKTFATGPTAARIAPGDEIRVAKSPDPEVVGDATWTNRKIGNSITFASAPTKQIDTMKSGWVTMGAGSTVTNGQATAYMMWGGTPGTGAALQVVTSAVANLAYKALGSTVDYSGHQQVSFWFRPAAAFDCSGAQNMYIRLCSDAAGTVPVDTLALPKWSYSSGMWYPIVIDKGSALGSNIQSVSITTTSNTSATFYFDEMFASPAAGLTLWSLIEDNDDTWYGIRTIRDADVWLLGVYTPTTATGSAPTTTYIDPGWVGTTATFSTRKRETFKAYATTGPANTTWCTPNEAGNWTNAVKQINQFRFGFNTATDTQDGLTFTDNLVALGTACSNGSYDHWRYENLVPVRWGTGFTNNSRSTEVNKIGAICCNIPITLSSWMTTSTVVLYNKTFEFLFVTGGTSSAPTLTGFTSGVGSMNFNISFGNVWGSYGWSISAMHGSTLTFKNLIHGNSTSSNAFNFTSSGYSIATIKRMETVVTTGFPFGSVSPTLLSIGGNSQSRIKIDNIYSGAGINISGNDTSILDIGEYAGVSSLVSAASTVQDGFIIRCASNNSSAALKWFAGIGLAPNGKLYIQDYAGAGTAAVFTGIGNGTGSIAPSYFELQTGDVHTSGSKAWKYNGQGFADFLLGSDDNLKLASVAAVANKEVTIACYVKNTTVYQDVYIRVPAIFLPGYTSDIKTSFTGTAGSWQQLTITFTPTADCVFDVLGGVYYNSTVADTNAVWDDLVITQAA